MKDVFIPRKEIKVKRLFCPVTPAEHTKIMSYCRKRKIKLTDLIRFSLKKQLTFKVLNI